MAPVDVIQDFNNNLEKKQRNLQKRKLKLDGYRDRLQRGETLSADQEKAITDYESVVQNINAIKDVLDSIVDLQAKVAQSMVEVDREVQAKKDEYAVEVLKSVVCLQKVFLQAHRPELRSAIIKASSENQMLSIDGAIAATSISLPKEFCGSSLGVSEITEKLSSEDSVAEAAKNLFNLAMGRKLPTSKPKGVSQKSRQQQKDVHSICMRLLGTPSVQKVLDGSADEQSCPPTIPATDKQVTHPSPVETIAVVKNVEQPIHQSAVVNRVEKQAVTQSAKNHAVAPAAAMDSVLASVITPIRGSCNFLQASKIEAIPGALPNMPVQSSCYTQNSSLINEKQTRPVNQMRMEHSKPATSTHAVPSIRVDAQEPLKQTFEHPDAPRLPQESSRRTYAECSNSNLQAAPRASAPPRNNAGAHNFKPKDHTYANGDIQQAAPNVTNGYQHGENGDYNRTFRGGRGRGGNQSFRGGGPGYSRGRGYPRGSGQYNRTNRMNSDTNNAVPSHC